MRTWRCTGYAGSDQCRVMLSVSVDTVFAIARPVVAFKINKLVLAGFQIKGQQQQPPTWLICTGSVFLLCSCRFDRNRLSSATFASGCVMALEADVDAGSLCTDSHSKIGPHGGASGRAPAVCGDDAPAVLTCDVVQCGPATGDRLICDVDSQSLQALPLPPLARHGCRKRAAAPEAVVPEAGQSNGCVFLLAFLCILPLCRQCLQHHAMRMFVFVQLRPCRGPRLCQRSWKF
jgi:hypothetical protein